MRKIKDVLRLKLDARLSHEQIAAALGISKGVVTKYVGLATAAGLDWATVQALERNRAGPPLCWPHQTDPATTCSPTGAASTRSCAARA